MEVNKCGMPYHILTYIVMCMHKIYVIYEHRYMKQFVKRGLIRFRNTNVCMVPLLLCNSP